MYWVLGDDCSLGDGGLYSLHLHKDLISLKISLHLLIRLEITMHEIRQILIDLPDIVLQVVRTLKVFDDGFSNKSQLVLVGSFQSFHGCPQNTDMPVDSATSAGPALYPLLPLEF